MKQFYAFAQQEMMGRLPLALLACLVVAGLYFFRQFLIGWGDLKKLHHEEHFLRDRMLAPLVAQVAPKDAIAIRKLRLQLVQAGFRSENAIDRYTQLRVLVLGVAAVCAALYAVSGADAVHVLGMDGLIIGVAVMGPESYVRRRAEARQAGIARALPMLTDLMVLCLDVGLSVESSFERVTAEMKTMEPLMAEEASLMLSEMGAGLTFPQALKRMADRIGTEDLTVLSRLIAQASQLGASVAQALREYAEASVTKRMLSLDERAGKISALLTLPITICLLPAAMIALVGPAIIIMVRSLGSG